MKKKLCAVVIFLVGCGGEKEISPVAPGSVQISEVFAWPHSGRAEWIELAATAKVGPSGMDLYGCVLVDGGLSSHRQGITSSLLLEPGSPLVFASEEYLVPQSELAHLLDLEGTGLVLQAQGQLGSISLVNEDIEELSIFCPGAAGELVLQDSVAWSDGIWPRPGRSWMRASGDRWCPAILEDSYYQDAGLREDRGSPGLPNPCPTPSPSPSPGQVRIDELMIAPATGPRDEWMELSNPSGESVDLFSCVLAVESDSGIHPHWFADGDGRTWLGPKERLLLGRGGDRLLPDGSLRADHAYGQQGLPNDQPFRLILSCPEGDGWQEIDSVELDWRDVESPRGFSLQRDGVVWCPASQQEQLFDDGWGQVAFGTPGWANTGCGS